MKIDKMKHDFNSDLFLFNKDWYCFIEKERNSFVYNLSYPNRLQVKYSTTESIYKFYPMVCVVYNCIFRKTLPVECITPERKHL